MPLNPFYEWIGEQQQYLLSIKEQLHPAVFDIAMRMLPGVAELHATHKPGLSAAVDGGLYFYWGDGDVDSPLFGMGISVDPPKDDGEKYATYNPWKPVHPPGVWNSF